MDQIARLYAEVSADATKYNKTMGQVNSSLMGTTSKFNNFFTGITQGFGQAFGQATIRGIHNVANSFGSVISMPQEQNKRLLIFSLFCKLQMRKQ